MPHISAPAHQRFKPRQRPALQLDHRLVDDEELVGLQRAAQVVFHRHHARRALRKVLVEPLLE